MSAVRSYLDTAFAAQRQRRWTHAWDQWEYTDYFFDPDPEVMALLEPLSDAGHSALTVALLEWQCFHFDSADKAEIAQNYADAAWVGLLSPGGCAFVSLDHADWAGPENGPLRAAALFVNDVLYDAAVDGQFSLRACWAVRLARHCCESALLSTFEAWLAECVHRLRQIAPRTDRVLPEDPFTPTFAPPALVSPTQLSLAASFHLVAADQDLKRHQVRIEYQNQFLETARAGGIN